MVCPMRLNVKMSYETNETLKTVVCTSKEETYPECYGEECPWYDTKYVTEGDKVKEVGVCKQTGSNGGEVYLYDE